jgi:hypothetical protein
MTCLGWCFYKLLLAVTHKPVTGGDVWKKFDEDRFHDIEANITSICARINSQQEKHST